MFKERLETFYEGDQVKFKITDRESGIVNSNEGRLSYAGADKVVVLGEGGKRTTLPSDSLAVKGMQLAYSATSHDFQGSTVDNVILAMDSREQLATQKSFYVGLSA